MAYDDGRIACTDDALVIRNYYFPVGDKRVPYQAIERVRVLPMSGISGGYRLWGSGDFVHWFNLDPGRPRKTVKLIIDIQGRRAKPVITPDTPDDVTAELAAHQVNIRHS
ncbi:MAG: PH domain-containing protein [Streptosporangiales bacterium]|jgi:hypothetical protein|nr:PH domain-containing protein [Streptosporangiales bacterium]